MKLVRIDKEEAIRLVKILAEHESPEVRKFVDKVAKKFRLEIHREFD